MIGLTHLSTQLRPWLPGIAGIATLALVAVASYRLGRGRRAAPQPGATPRAVRASVPPAGRSSPWAFVTRHTPRRAQRPVPIDLSRPVGAAEWAILGRIRGDARYRHDLGIVRARYQIVGNPMLLPNTIRETMATYRVDLTEAICLIAQDRSIR